MGLCVAGGPCVGRQACGTVIIEEWKFMAIILEAARNRGRQTYAEVFVGAAIAKGPAGA
jgi:hypothetical protein